MAFADADEEGVDDSSLCRLVSSMCVCVRRVRWRLSFWPSLAWFAFELRLLFALCGVSG